MVQKYIVVEDVDGLATGSFCRIEVLPLLLVEEEEGRIPGEMIEMKRLYLRHSSATLAERMVRE
jgi:hypothetical protein